jgi:tol-pal system protein YbgF
MASNQVIKLPLQGSPGASQPGPGDTTSAEETPPPAATPSADCIDTYDKAFTQVRRGEYDAAIEGFRSFLAECPDHSDVENAYYWIGECYYSQEKYTQAIAEYEHLIQAYPDSPNVGRALYKLARCKQEIGKTDEARKLFEQLVNEHAGTLEAEQAAQRLKDLQ